MKFDKRHYANGSGDPNYA